MALVSDSFANLEAQRLKLEGNYQELQRSIYHWRTWDAEYDGLKAEIATLDEKCTQEEIIQAARNYSGTVVTDDEIKLFTGEKQGVSRTRRQVEAALERRIDYVQENLRVLEKRFTNVEDELQKLQEKLFELSRKKEGEVQDAESLPIIDIIEQLDDDGNVISRATKTPEQDAPRILAALKEAGVDKLLQKGLEHRRRGNEISESPDSQTKQIDEGPDDQTTQPSSQIPEDQNEASKVTPDDGVAQTLSQKSQEDMRISEEASQVHEQNESVASSIQSTEQSVDSTETDITDHNNDDIAMPLIDESPEEAALRREILRYGMEEVGAVVAELELDEDANEVSIDEYYDEDYSLEDDDEEEDEYGRSTKSLITEEYRAQMEELERQLTAKGLYNAGPNPALMASKSVIKPVAEAVAKVETAPVSSVKKDDSSAEALKKKTKKRVAFADSLDIAPDPGTRTGPPVRHILEASETAIKEEVIERTGFSNVAPATPPPAEPAKRVSRFKSARKAGEPTSFAKVAPPVGSAVGNASSKQLSQDTAPSTVPTKAQIPRSLPHLRVEPEAEDPSIPRPLMTDKLVERESFHDTATPPDPDDFDEVLHRQEITTEFYRARNRKIAQEGGFTKESIEERQTVPLDEDESGQPIRKPSRFMAARMERR
ncbi:hypothetical protein KEM54_000556 [Ascosphaera aggregata]|nr:hypothetical protein KEM54_000556 [Ascosphaera aggregata]